MKPVQKKSTKRRFFLLLLLFSAAGIGCRTVRTEAKMPWRMERIQRLAVFQGVSDHPEIGRIVYEQFLAEISRQEGGGPYFIVLSTAEIQKNWGSVILDYPLPTSGTFLERIPEYKDAPKEMAARISEKTGSDGFAVLWTWDWYAGEAPDTAKTTKVGRWFQGKSGKQDVVLQVFDREGRDLWHSRLERNWKPIPAPTPEEKRLEETREAARAGRLLAKRLKTWKKPLPPEAAARARVYEFPLPEATGTDKKKEEKPGGGKPAAPTAPSLTAILDNLESADPEKRQAAGLDLKPEHREDLEAILTATARDPVQRRRAALALGLLADPAAEPALVRALSDPDSSVRIQVCEALSEVAGRAGLQALEKAAREDSDGRVRETAARAGIKVRRRLR